MCLTANKFSLDVDAVAVMCQAQRIAERQEDGGEETDFARLGANTSPVLYFLL
jgi:hypothetical protein